MRTALRRLASWAAMLLAGAIVFAAIYAGVWFVSGDRDRAFVIAFFIEIPVAIVTAILDKRWNG